MLSAAGGRAGLRDAHLHLAEYGESLSLVDLSRCESVGACLELVARASGSVPRDAWVRGAGLRIEGLRERRAPSAKELDEAGGGRCVLLRSFDHHSVAVSAAALRVAGISRASIDPPGGVIVRGAGGEPTGLLLEHACDAVWKAVPAPSEAEYLGHVRRALGDLSGRGFVEAHDMFAREPLVRALLALEARGELALSMTLYATAEHFDAVRAACAGAKSERVRFGGLKMFADGTLNSRTALMLTDYADPLPGRPRGEALLSVDQIAAGFARALASGCGAAVHAIGDGAVRNVLDALERVGAQGGGGPKGGAFGPGREARIEHAQFVDEADVARIFRLGAVVSPQPCHLLTDVEAIERRMPHRPHRAFPMADLEYEARGAGLDPASVIWLGSDAPVVPPEPGDNVQAAVHRCRAGDSRKIAPEQAIDEGLCWSMMRARLRG